MITPYVEMLNEKKTVYIGRVCSCCGSPVISRVVAQSHVATGFWRVVHTDIARTENQIAAKKAVAETIREIEISKREHTAISSKPHVNDTNNAMFLHKFLQETFIEGITEACPNCFAVEPWMPKCKSRKTLEQLQDENFPSTFQTDAEATQWALTHVAETARQIQDIRQSPEAATAAQDEAQSLQTAMQELEEHRKHLRLAEKMAVLEQERTALQANEYNIGLLDIRGRRTLKKAKERVEYHIRELEKEIPERLNPMDAKLTELRIALQKALAIANGCTNQILVCRAENALSFHPEIVAERTQLFPGAQPYDVSTNADQWQRELVPLKTRSRFCLPDTRFMETSLTESVGMIMFSIMFAMCYLEECLHLFRKGFNPFFLLAFAAVVAIGTVDYLYLAGTNENRKKHAGSFYLIFISILLLTVSITGIVTALIGGLQTRLVLSVAATAAIPLIAFLIHLKQRGVQLTKLRLFTKKDMDASHTPPSG